MIILIFGHLMWIEKSSVNADRQKNIKTNHWLTELSVISFILNTRICVTESGQEAFFPFS